MIFLSKAEEAVPWIFLSVTDTSSAFHLASLVVTCLFLVRSLLFEFFGTVKKSWNAHAHSAR